MQQEHAATSTAMPREHASLTGALLVLGGLYAVVLAQVNQHAPEPYMVRRAMHQRSVTWHKLTLCVMHFLCLDLGFECQDEIFHIPQTQKYCDGKFDEWDPKITTFPGLYLFATAYARAVKWMQLPGVNFCAVPVLRSVNVLFALGNAVLIAKLRRLLSPSNSHLLVHALMIISFPVHFFFAFLFYTDGGATFFVLLMYVLAEQVDVQLPPARRGSCILSAVCGALAILFRQTNIVWVLFVAGTLVVRYVEHLQGSFIYGYAKDDHHSKTAFVPQNSPHRVFINFIAAICSNLGFIVRLAWPFIAIVAGFVGFLVLNGGIVVGDKSNHEAGVHGAQLLYCTVVIASGFGINLIEPKKVLEFLRSVYRSGQSVKGMAFMVCLTLAMAAIIWRLSPVHKFMLADNRHYTFYIWRKFFLRHRFAKFVPLPMYLFAGWRCWVELRQRRSPLWAMVYVLAVSLVLIPSPLVEPRYYLLPFVVFHLNAGNQSSSSLWTTIVAYTIVNVCTLYVFMHRSYEWVDGSTARFMW